MILAVGAMICAVLLAPTPDAITLAIAAMACCAGSLGLGFFVWRFTRIRNWSKSMFLTATAGISIAGSVVVFGGLRFLPALFR